MFWQGKDAFPASLTPPHSLPPSLSSVLMVPSWVLELPLFPSLFKAFATSPLCLVHFRIQVTYGTLPLSTWVPWGAPETLWVPVSSSGKRKLDTTFVHCGFLGELNGIMIRSTTQGLVQGPAGVLTAPIIAVPSSLFWGAVTLHSILCFASPPTKNWL